MRRWYMHCLKNILFIVAVYKDDGTERMVFGHPGEARTLTEALKAERDKAMALIENQLKMTS